MILFHTCFLDNFFHRNRAKKMGKKLLKFKNSKAQYEKWKWLIGKKEQTMHTIVDQYIPTYLPDPKKRKKKSKKEADAKNERIAQYGYGHDQNGTLVKFDMANVNAIRSKCLFK